MNATRKCIVDGCERNYSSLGYCHAHYQRVNRHGDPLGGAHDVGKPLTDQERFMKKVQKKDSGCWEWSASGVYGYGRFWLGGRKVLAHRVSWFFHTGAMPADDVLMCHRCDNPPCVNPDHLFEGSPLDNTRDMIAKGRSFHQKAARVRAGKEKNDGNKE